MFFVGNHKNRDNDTIFPWGLQGGVLYKINKSILYILPVEIDCDVAISMQNRQISFFDCIVLCLTAPFRSNQLCGETVAFWRKTWYDVVALQERRRKRLAGMERCIRRES